MQYTRVQNNTKHYTIQYNTFDADHFGARVAAVGGGALRVHAYGHLGSAVRGGSLLYTGGGG